jgi:hypothetical protein
MPETVNQESKMPKVHFLTVVMPEEEKKPYWPWLLLVVAVLCLLGGLVYINRPPAGFKRLAATGDMFKAVKLAPN